MFFTQGEKYHVEMRLAEFEQLREKRKADLEKLRRDRINRMPVEELKKSLLETLHKHSRKE